MAAFIAKMMRLSPTTPEKIARKIHKIINSTNPPLRLPVQDCKQRIFKSKMSQSY